MQEEARTFGAGLRIRLDQTIRQTALPVLGRALGRWARNEHMDLASDDVREELERAALTLMFRMLFLLYAEAAGYLPMDTPTTTSPLTAEKPLFPPPWDRLSLLVKAMRTGNPAWGVPAYNGALFSADGFDGAATLERIELPTRDRCCPHRHRARPESGQGVDYSTLEIGHLGHIYEGLLSLRLSLADTPLRYDLRSDRYTAPECRRACRSRAGDLLWQTHEGGQEGRRGLLHALRTRPPSRAPDGRTIVRRTPERVKVKRRHSARIG